MAKGQWGNFRGRAKGRPALISGSVVLDLGADGGEVRIAVVSDTHSRPHPKLLARLRALKPKVILHAGDIGDLTLLDELAAVAPVHAVRGNIDGRAADTPDVLVVDLRTGVGSTRLLLTHVALGGVRLRSDAAERARAHGAQLVVCGHSHLPFIGRHGRLTVFNPGSAGPRRIHLPIVFGTIDVTPAGLRLGHVDCETGLPWRPPG